MRRVFAVRGRPGVATRRHREPLRLVIACNFGASLCAGRVNGCENVQELPLQLFAGNGSAQQAGAACGRVAKSLLGQYEVEVPLRTSPVDEETFAFGSFSLIPAQ